MIAHPVELNDLPVDVLLTSVAQGDILFRGASKWNNLGIGTTGKVLTSNGAGANPSWETPSTGVTAHSGLTGLTSGDDHTQYAYLAGRSGGQTLIGGTASANNLLLKPTSHATLGYVGIPYAPQGVATYPLFAVGSGPFDGTTAGFFTGSSSGTAIGVNAASGFVGNLLDVQVAGVARARITGAGYLQLGSSAASYTGLLQMKQTSAPSSKIIVIDAADSNGSTRPSFFVNVAATDNAASARDDQVLTMGWNLSSGGGAVIAGEPAQGLSFESFFDPFVEFHYLFIPSVTTNLDVNYQTQVRPMSFTINPTSNNIDCYHVVSQFTLFNPTNADAYVLVSPSAFNIYGADFHVKTAAGTTKAFVQASDGESYLRSLGLNTPNAGNFAGTLISIFANTVDSTAWLKGTSSSTTYGMGATIETWGSGGESAVGCWWTSETAHSVGLRNGSNRWVRMKTDGTFQIASAGTTAVGLKSNGADLEIQAGGKYRAPGTGGVVVGLLYGDDSDTGVFVGLSGGTQLRFVGDYVQPANNGAFSDNTRYLGHPSARWKSFYLAGSAVIDGALTLQGSATFQLAAGAGAGKRLISDASGFGTWQTPVAYTTHVRICTASTNAVSVKASAGNVYGWYLSNTHATAWRYFKLYNKASAPTVGTDTPVDVIAIPPGGAANVNFVDGIAFSTGIAFAVTGGVANADTTITAADDCVINLYYI